MMRWGTTCLLSRIPQSRLSLAFAAAGALIFWVPDVLIHVAAGRGFGFSDVRAVTLALPIAFLIGYISLRRISAHYGYRPLGNAMLAGVWLTGGLFMMVSASMGGGGFVGVNDIWVSILIVALSVIPIVTFILAAYDGSLLALLAVTVGAILVWGVRTGGIPFPFIRSPKQPATNPDDPKGRVST
jgi:hypothetical protein